MKGGNLKVKKQYRLTGWDYSSEGYYFVMICTKNKKNFFGKIDGYKVVLSKIGWIVRRYWLEIPRHFRNIRLDAFIIMPNHIHGIIQIKYKRRNVALPRSYGENYYSEITPPSKSISTILGSFKSICTKRIRFNLNPNFAWQPRFHDRIIRDDKELNTKRNYIKNNILKHSNNDFINI